MVEAHGGWFALVIAHVYVSECEADAGVIFWGRVESH